MTLSTQAAMDRFVRRENLKHYRELLSAAKCDQDRQRVLKLLAEEEQKQRDAGDECYTPHCNVAGETI